VRILAIDGGGIRGVIPARVLVELERESGRRISELFDLLAGTSTGGIIALGLAKPDQSGAPQFSATDLLSLYTSEGPTIFPKTSLGFLRPSLFGRANAHRAIGAVLNPRIYGNARYHPEGLEKTLYRFVGDALLGSALVPVLITTYDAVSKRPVLLRSTDPTAGRMRMIDVARATSAAPTYFPPVSSEGLAFIDGGVYANNPSSVAFFDALSTGHGSETVTLVSLGTGRPPKRSLTYEEIETQNWASLGTGFVSTMFDAGSEIQDVAFSHLQQSGRLNGYWRFQTILEGCNAAMDDASTGNLQALVRIAESMLASRVAEIDEIVNRLTAGRA